MGNKLVRDVFTYPIKSLPGASLDIREEESTRLDRSYQLRTVESGEVVTGKWAVRNSCSEFWTIRVEWLADRLGSIRSVALSTAAGSVKGEVIDFGDRFSLEAWFSSALNTKVRLESADSNSEGFHDDEGRALTMMSEATIRAIAVLFDLTYDEVVTRFRPNIVLGYNAIGGSEYSAFSEYVYHRMPSRLLLQSGLFEVLGPVRRCVVPSCDPLNGEKIPHFYRRYREYLEGLENISQITENYPKFLQGNYAAIGLRRVS